MFVTHYGKKLISLPLLNIMEEALFEKGENAVFLFNFSETCVQWLLIISFCHELLCVDFLQIFEIFASKEMFLKKWALPPPFILDLMSFTPFVLLIEDKWTNVTDDETWPDPQKAKTNIKKNKNTIEKFNYVNLTRIGWGLRDKWYIDATKFFLLAILPEDPPSLQMTIRK